MYKGSVFGLSLLGSVAAVALLIYLVLSSTIAMSLLPVVGIGGLYGSADEFAGQKATVFPQHGGAATGSSQYTATPTCQNRPMLVIRLEDDVEIRGFQVRKDIELPFLRNRYFSININQPLGSASDDPAFIEATQARLFITQLEIDELIARNAKITEGGRTVAQEGPSTPDSEISQQKWGPNSGEFLLIAGQNNQADNPGPGGTPGLDATGANAWIHGVTADSVVFRTGDQESTIEIDMQYLTESELEDFYDGELGYNLPSGQNPETGVTPPSFERDDYFDCVPPN
jgi:hypothetical protein